MREPARSSRREYLLALLALFILVPTAAMLLFVSHAGRAWLGRIAVRPEPVAVLPGITVEAAPSKTVEGLVITSIRSGSPAALRGVAVGDAIVAIDGTPMFSLDQARRYLQKDRAQTVALRVVHGRQSRDVDLVREGGQGEP